MATFFSNIQVGRWSNNVPLLGTLNGSVSRNNNTVTVSGLLTVIASTPVSGSKQLVFTLGSSATPLMLTGNNTTNFGNLNISPANFSVSPTQTSQVVSWQTSDGFSGQFLITFPAPPAAPTISATTISHDTIEVTYGTTSFGSPATGTVTLYGSESSSPTTQIDAVSTTGNKTFTFAGLSPSTTYYFKATADNGQMSSNSSVKSATTMPEPIFYIPVGGKAKKTKKLYCSVNGKTKLVEKLYGSVNGKTKRVL